MSYSAKYASAFYGQAKCALNVSAPVRQPEYLVKNAIIKWTTKIIEAVRSAFGIMEEGAN
jgi:delta-aminolevulinic acid dehydratase/porphobilinogen synthase